jgi:hypothetical protein
MSRSEYRRAGHTVKRPPMMMCFLGLFGRMEHDDPMPRCDGRLVRCHLIPKALVQKHGGDVWDERAWVWGCGGPTGIGGHHGMLDKARTLRLPRQSLPPGVEALAHELELEWWLAREYGPK